MKEKLAFTLLRVGMGTVFLIFGIGKFRDDIWAETIKGMEIFQGLPWSVELTVFVIGVSEVVIGICLIAGLFTRISAALAALELTVILILLNFQETRDIGLLAAALYITLVENRGLGADYFLRRRTGRDKTPGTWAVGQRSGSPEGRT